MVILALYSTFLSGREVLKLLRPNISLITIDEVHASLKDQWGNEKMREEMYRAPSFLKSQVVSSLNAPTHAMTASLKVSSESRKEKSQLDQVKIMCSIQYSKTLVISISPILHNHIFITLKKPPNLYGFYGDSFGTEEKLGKLHILWRLYLNTLFLIFLVNVSLIKQSYLSRTLRI